MKTNRIMTWPIYRFGLRQNWNWTIRTYLIWCDLWWKPNKITMWSTIQVWSAPKMKLSFRDRSNQVSCVMKTRQDSNVTDLTCAVYDENDIELSRLIGSGDDNDGNQIEQLCDWLYNCSLHRKWNWVVVTNHINCSLWCKLDKTTTWLIIKMRSTSKRKLSYYVWLNRVRNMTRKWRGQYISLVYFKTELNYRDLSNWV